MKKKWLIGILSGLCVAACVVGFSACGHTHNYTDVVTNPTCTAQGYTTHTCECGDTYKDTYVEALGHSFTDYVSDGNATYISDGTKTAECDNGCDKTDTITDVGSMLVCGVQFATFIVDDTNVSQKLRHATEEFDFNNEISIDNNVCTYVVSDTTYANNPYLMQKVPLQEGENIFYVTIMYGNTTLKQYEVRLYRNHMYTVSFTSQGGTVVQSQQVEEGYLATEPQAPTKDGYDFTGWDFDFNTPITGNTRIVAQWKEREDAFVVSGNTITGLTPVGKKVTDLYIPSQIDGVEITAIDSSAFFNCQNLTSVVIGNGITSIGFSAFEACSSLTEVVIGDSVTSIGNYAFAGCTSLTSVTIGNGVTSIGDWTFKNCSSLTEIVIPDGVTWIGYEAFAQGGSLKSVTIGNGVTSIGYGAFAECGNLREIIIPVGVTDMWGAVFQCSGIITIYCEAISQPSGWSNNWNISSVYDDVKFNVVWGYTGN